MELAKNQGKNNYLMWTFSIQIFKRIWMEMMKPPNNWNK